jgi:hypothetical protein
VGQVGREKLGREKLLGDPLRIAASSSETPSGATHAERYVPCCDGWLPSAPESAPASEPASEPASVPESGVASVSVSVSVSAHE